MSATDRPLTLPEPLSPAPAGRPLVRAAAPETERRPTRVAIATMEINGPTRNGGIGTAYTALAEVLAGAGHDVTVLYLQGRLVDRRSIRYWVANFQARGIRLVPLPESAFPLGGSRSL